MLFGHFQRRRLHMFERILPGSFIELLAGILLLAALVFTLASLFKENKRPITRLAAILFVSSLCLFSDNGWIYFVGVFIIATAIIDLDFIQNVVGIFKGTRQPSSSPEPDTKEVPTK